MSQIQKFNARVAKATKNRMDKDALASKALQEALEEPRQLPREKELKEEGNIQEAAAVFSHEGMKAFAHIFSNSVGATVEKSLDVKIERLFSSLEDMVETKLLEVIQGLSQGIKRFNGEPEESELDWVPRDVGEFTEEEVPKEEPSEEETVYEHDRPEPVETDFEQEISDGTEVRKMGLSKHDMEEIIPIVKKILSDNGEPMKLTELTQTLRNEHQMEFRNPSMLMNKVISNYPSISKVGFGLYGLEEKTFREVINLG